MFSISSQPLDLLQLRKNLRSKKAGAFVEFTGMVRDHNDGHAVESLEYEVFHELAKKDGERILAEVKARFGILEAHGVHREGHLTLEDPAVWVGVLATHRKEAFEACRFIIDELKWRLPIWKKEHYVGVPEAKWVSCHGCHGSILDEAEYFKCQTNLGSVGNQGQKRLRDAKVLVVGAGGLGCPVLTSLATAGVGQIKVSDPDVIELSNLLRQPLYSPEDLGRKKVEVCAQKLSLLTPFCKVEPVEDPVTPTNVLEMIDEIDLVLDCTDDLQAKYLLHDACYWSGVPLVQAGLYMGEGIIQAFLGAQNPEGAGCLRCWQKENISESICVESCSDIGILGVVANFVGLSQASVAIQLLLGQSHPAGENTLVLDVGSLSTTSLRRTQDPACMLCGESPKIQQLDRGRYAIRMEMEISERDFSKNFSRADLQFIDIRERAEILDDRSFDTKSENDEVRFFGEDRKHIPLSDFSLEDLEGLDSSRPVVLICKRGKRSLSLAASLRNQGIHEVYSWKGGTDGLIR